MVYIGIKDGKIYDVCSRIEWKRDNSIPDKDYLDLNIKVGDVRIGDTINSDGSGHIKDSPTRFKPIPKSQLELKLEDLQKQINELKNA